jgi:hypothetical protein
MRIAVVWWIDSSTDDNVHESYSLTDEINPLAIISTGILLKSDKEHITVSRDLFKQPVTEDTVRYRICIPKSAVQKMLVFELEVNDDK